LFTEYIPFFKYMQFSKYMHADFDAVARYAQEMICAGEDLRRRIRSLPGAQVPACCVGFAP
jgi:hypothetical protein